MDEDGRLFEITAEINTAKMFFDDRDAREKCGGDFCDQTLKTTVYLRSSHKSASF